MIDRRTLVGGLPWPWLNGPVSSAESLPDAGAMRLWTLMAESQAMRLTGDREIGSPANVAEMRRSFKNYVGDLPYRFRAAHTGEVITVLSIDDDGRAVYA